jgi:hypothetical protein
MGSLGIQGIIVVVVGVPIAALLVAVTLARPRTIPVAIVCAVLAAPVAWGAIAAAEVAEPMGAYLIFAVAVIMALWAIVVALRALWIGAMALRDRPRGTPRTIIVRDVPVVARYTNRMGPSVCRSKLSTETSGARFAFDLAIWVTCLTGRAAPRDEIAAAIDGPLRARLAWLGGSRLRMRGRELRLEVPHYLDELEIARAADIVVTLVERLSAELPPLVDPSAPPYRPALAGDQARARDAARQAEIRRPARVLLDVPLGQPANVVEG